MSSFNLTASTREVVIVVITYFERGSPADRFGKTGVEGTEVDQGV